MVESDPTTDSETDATAGEGLERPIAVETGDELEAVVADHEVVLVEFYTKGCTLCQAMEPVVGIVARATDTVVVTVNPQTDLSLVETYDIRSVPTLVLFVDGEPVERVADGFVGADELVDVIERHAEGL